MGYLLKEYFSDVSRVNLPVLKENVCGKCTVKLTVTIIYYFPAKWLVTDYAVQLCSFS